MGATKQAKGSGGRRQRGQAPRRAPPTLAEPTRLGQAPRQAPPNAGLSQCRVPSSPGDARSEAPCIRKTKISPFPPGRGGGGMGAVNQAKGRSGRRQRGQAPRWVPPTPAEPTRLGQAPPPPTGCEICFLLRRLKINPVAVAFFEKPLAFLRKIWYNTIQSCTVACSCARKPARV